MNMKFNPQHMLGEAYLFYMGCASRKDVADIRNQQVAAFTAAIQNFGGNDPNVDQVMNPGGRLDLANIIAAHILACRNNYKQSPSMRMLGIIDSGFEVLELIHASLAATAENIKDINPAFNDDKVKEVAKLLELVKDALPDWPKPPGAFRRLEAMVEAIEDLPIARLSDLHWQKTGEVTFTLASFFGLNMTHNNLTTMRKQGQEVLKTLHTEPDYGVRKTIGDFLNKILDLSDPINAMRRQFEIPLAAHLRSPITNLIPDTSLLRAAKAAKAARTA